MIERRRPKPHERIEVLLKERHALCDTMAEAGAEAPTLCTGWLTADLAAHLLAREKRPDAAPGVVLGGPFAKHTQRVMDGYKAKGYDVMLSELRQGPPKWMRAGPLAKANVGENWIHHEDVRRANGQGPRPPDPELDDILWGALGPCRRPCPTQAQGRRFGSEVCRRSRAHCENGGTARDVAGAAGRACALDGGAPGVRGGGARR